jgi:hypothetical protein
VLSISEYIIELFLWLRKRKTIPKLVYGNISKVINVKLADYVIKVKVK